MPQQNQPTVVVATWTAGPSCRAVVGDDLGGLSRAQIEKLLHHAQRSGTELAALAASGLEQLDAEKYAAARGTDVTAIGNTAVELFPHEKVYQKIVLAFAKTYYGYDYPKKDRQTCTRLRNITLDHGTRETDERYKYKLSRDTIIDILREADPLTGCWRDRSNREKSYYKLVSALAHEHYGDGKGGVRPDAAKEIASLVGDQGDAVEVEVVSELLKQAERALERNF